MNTTLNDYLRSEDTGDANETAVLVLQQLGVPEEAIAVLQPALVLWYVAEFNRSRRRIERNEVGPALVALSSSSPAIPTASPHVGNAGGPSPAQLAQRKGGKPAVPRAQWLLATFKPARGGQEVTWADATLDQHRERIGMLKTHIESTVETMNRHVMAVQRIESTPGAKCLRDVVDLWEAAA